MNPPRATVDLRSRNWRTQLKAALDAAFGDPLSEAAPPSIDAELKALK